MDFIEAIRQMKEGKKVKRPGRDGYIEFTEDLEEMPTWDKAKKAVQEGYPVCVGSTGMFEITKDAVYLVENWTGSKLKQPWLSPSMLDAILSDDWEVVDQ